MSKVRTLVSMVEKGQKRAMKAKAQERKYKRAVKQLLIEKKNSKKNK